MTTALGFRVKALMLNGVDHAGSYKPVQVLPLIEEHLTGDEAATVQLFLEWLMAHQRTIDADNIDEAFATFRGPVRRTKWGEARWVRES